MEHLLRGVGAARAFQMLDNNAAAQKESVLINPSLKLINGVSIPRLCSIPVPPSIGQGRGSRGARGAAGPRSCYATRLQQPRAGGLQQLTYTLFILMLVV